MQITRRFGRKPAARGYDAIFALPSGRLEVGQALVVPTRDARVTHLVVAPTMPWPEAVPASHAYRALRAALRVARAHALPELWSTSLATGVGLVPPEEAAREMAEAYGDAKRG